MTEREIHEGARLLRWIGAALLVLLLLVAAVAFGPRLLDSFKPDRPVNTTIIQVNLTTEPSHPTVPPPSETPVDSGDKSSADSGSSE